MIKSILKILLFISLVLAFGQIPAGKGTVGSEFLNGVNQSCRWSSQRLMETKWLSGVELPSSLKNWLEMPAEKKKKPYSSLEDDVSKTDREAMLKLLQ